MAVMEEKQIIKTRSRKGLAMLDSVEIYRLAEDKMQVEKRYLDPYLTMESLAMELNVHRNALSAAVNRYAKTSFTLWLTSYRVAEVERLATAKENQGVSLEKLSQLAGFANRTSFYRGFKNIRGVAPVEWQKMKKEMKN